MKIKDSTLQAAVMILIGLLFIFLKGNVVSIVLTVIGVLLLITAIMDYLNKSLPTAILKAAIGVLLIVAGWAVASIALYIVSALILIYGAYCLFNDLRLQMHGTTPLTTALLYAEPVLCVVAGLLLLFNQAATVDWIFTAAGILLIVDGALTFLRSFSE